MISAGGSRPGERPGRDFSSSVYGGLEGVKKPLRWSDFSPETPSAARDGRREASAKQSRHGPARRDRATQRRCVGIAMITSPLTMAGACFLRLRGIGGIKKSLRWSDFSPETRIDAQPEC